MSLFVPDVLAHSGFITAYHNAALPTTPCTSWSGNPIPPPIFNVNGADLSHSVVLDLLHPQFPVNDKRYTPHSDAIGTYSRAYADTLQTMNCKVYDDTMGVLHRRSELPSLWTWSRGGPWWKPPPKTKVKGTTSIARARAAAAQSMLSRSDQRRDKHRAIRQQSQNKVGLFGFGFSAAVPMVDTDTAGMDDTRKTDLTAMVASHLGNALDRKAIREAAAKRVLTVLATSFVYDFEHLYITWVPLRRVTANTKQQVEHWHETPTPLLLGPPIPDAPDRRCVFPPLVIPGQQLTVLRTTLESLVNAVVYFQDDIGIGIRDEYRAIAFAPLESYLHAAP